MILRPKKSFLLAIFVVLVLAVGTYFIFLNRETASDRPATMATSTEDGVHEGYIKKMYTKDSKVFVDVDYIQTLTGREAAIRQLNNGSCLPQDGWTKEQVIAEINKLKGSETDIADAMYDVPGMGNCGPNGWWVDVNDNPKIRTFQLDLKKPIVMAYDRSEEGFGDFKHVEYDVEVTIDDKPVIVRTGGYEVSEETFRKVIAGVAYNIPFKVTIEAGKVTWIEEIYRP